MKVKTIKYSELVPSVMSAAVFKALKQRGKLHTARIAGPGFEMTVYVETIPERYKDRALQQLHRLDKKNHEIT